MGLSLMSALMIQGNETKVETYSNEEKNRYGFIIYLIKEGEIHTEIVSTIPNFPYKSNKEARSEGENLVNVVKEMDLGPEISGLQKKLGNENSKIVSGIIQEANKKD